MRMVRARLQRMRVHSIRSIPAFNAKDFIRYQDITVLDPAGVS